MRSFCQVYKTQASPVRPWGSSGFYITTCFSKAGLALMLPRSSRRKRRQASCPCSPGAPWPSSSPANPYATLTSRHALSHLHACSLTPPVHCLAHSRASRVHALTKPSARSLILFRKVGSGGGVSPFGSRCLSRNGFIKKPEYLCPPAGPGLHRRFVC